MTTANTPDEIETCPDCDGTRLYQTVRDHSFPYGDAHGDELPVWLTCRVSATQCRDCDFVIYGPETERLRDEAVAAFKASKAKDVKVT
jgi:hypothetical protein